MAALLRQASRDDILGMHRVRLSVRENELTSTVVAEADYAVAMEQGRAWVIELDSRVVAFAVGNARTGNIWALFVEPSSEGRGYGRRLHSVMVEWLWSEGLDRLWLTTQPHTRAERFYEAAGWRRMGRTERGELRLELRRPTGEGARK